MNKIILAVSSFLLFVLLVVIYLQKNTLGLCSGSFLRCETYIAFLIIFLPVTIFSILEKFFKKTLYLWEKFTVVFLGIYFVVTITSASQAGFLQPSRGDLALLLSGIYVIISTGIFIFYWKK